MVNNNGMPIEVNKKPFETVYELKNETPSFEEFMRNYENDGNLNYDDLSGSSVGEVERYGPCDTCKKSTVWRNLHMPCPGVKKGNPCSNSTRRMDWVHASCGSPSQISNKCHIRCSRSSCDADYHMSHWNFSCSAHEGRYWSTKGATFADALSWVMNIGHYDELVNDIIVHMSNHRNDSEVKSGWWTN